MSFNNTLALISNSQELVRKISDKLVLLRDLDKTVNSPLDKAYEFLKSQMPNTIMLHCKENDVEAINLINKIKKDEILKEVPVIFVAQDCTRETIIEAFDCGISDLILAPIEDYELLIRTIWCIQKNEVALRGKTHVSFMKQLGIIDSATNIYTKKFAETFLENEIEQSNEYKATCSIMAIYYDFEQKDAKTKEEFIQTLHNSIRLNDSILEKDDNEFYIHMPKTKALGASPVFQRINDRLGLKDSLSACVVEISGQTLSTVKLPLQIALEKAKQEKGSLIVADNPDIKVENAGINLAKENLINTNSDTAVLMKKAQGEKEDEDKLKMYLQTYKQKCKILIEPIFKKYEKLICEKVKDASVKFDINVDTTMFSANKESTFASLLISYGGDYKVKIDKTLTVKDRVKNSETVSFDLVQLNFQKLSALLEELYIEFKDYSKNAV